jgi:hypothetical protein
MDDGVLAAEELQVERSDFDRVAGRDDLDVEVGTRRIGDALRCCSASS